MASKGRPRNIKTPEDMQAHFNAFRKQIKSKPITVKDWVGGMAKQVTREKERPLTLEGFSIYCFENEITNNVHDYFQNKNGAYEDFSVICSRIKEIIRQDQIEGGLAGIYNPSITQRLNGLTEKVETKNEHKVEKLSVEVVHTGVLPASSEKDIKL